MDWHYLKGQVVLKDSVKIKVSVVNLINELLL